MLLWHIKQELDNSTSPSTRLLVEGLFFIIFFDMLLAGGSAEITLDNSGALSIAIDMLGNHLAWYNSSSFIQRHFFKR